VFQKSPELINIFLKTLNIHYRIQNPFPLLWERISLFILVIFNNKASIIVAYQYSSADTAPSMEDINVTKRLFEAGEVTWGRGGRLF